jgi:hypothetical protein
MNAKVLKPVAIPASLTVVAALAQLLQRLELSSVPVSPEQYRSVVQRLTDALREAPPGEALDALLAALPAAAYRGHPPRGSARASERPGARTDRQSLPLQWPPRPRQGGRWEG